MNAKEFQALCIQPDTSLREALLRMDQAARGILLVLRADGSLARTLTDGDLRRAMIGQLAPQSPVSALSEPMPITVTEDADAAAVLALMDKHQIDHVPVLASSKPVDVIFRRELSQRVWLSSPHLGDEEAAFVEEAFKTNWIAPLGPHVDGFERELAAHVGVAHAAALSSGTAALHLGLLLLGVKAGDTVMCSSLTFVASCNPILYCGARPVFIDSEPDTWNMSPAALERALDWARRENRLPRCIVIVNLYGQSADMDALLPICERYGVPVLEDAAESLGATYKGRASGAFGRLAVYSFNGNKIITTSGGGMLVADDADVIARARKLSTQARDAARHYEHSELGFNYRMSNVLAGIGRGQLKVLSQRVAQRRAVFERYQMALADVPQIQWMPQPHGYFSTRWLSCFTLNLTGAKPGGNQAAGGGTGASDLTQSSAQCERLMRALERHSIEARPVWKPMHLQPLFAGAPYFSHGDGTAAHVPTDVSAALFGAGVCLPSGSNMAPEQQDRVIDQLKRAIGLLERAA